MSASDFIQRIRGKGVIRIPANVRKEKNLNDGDYVKVAVEKVEK